MLVYKEKHALTVAAGAASVDLDVKRGRLGGVYITPVAEIDTYTVTIVDGDGFKVFERNQTGSLGEPTVITVYGDYQLQISSASQDGAYSVKVLVEE